MSRVYSLQQSFKKGAFGRELLARSDTDVYYQGASSMQDVVCRGLGGFSRRPGTLFIADVGEDAKLFGLTRTQGKRYFVAVGATNIKIYVVDETQSVATLSATTATIPSPYGADFASIDYTTFGNDAIIVHPDHPPKVLIRGASDANWTLTDMSFDVLPKFDYDDADSPAPTDCVIAFDTGSLTTSSQVVIALNGDQTQPFGMGSSSSLDLEAFRIAVEALPNIHAGPDNLALASGAPTEFTLTLTGKNSGEYAVTSYVDSGSGSISSNITTQGDSREEDAWSATRGYPSCATIFSSRLYLAGVPAAPVMVYGSEVARYTSFYVNKALDDEAVAAPTASNTADGVLWLTGTRNLQALTASGTYAAGESVVKPESFALIEQSNDGASACKPVNIEGSIVYLHKSGNSIRAQAYSDELKAVESASVSSYNPEYVRSPASMAVLRTPDNPDTNILLSCNDDGTIHCLTIQSQEAMNAASLWTTSGGSFKSVAAVGDTAAAIVERDGSYFLEQFDWTIWSDSTSKASAGVIDISYLSVDVDVIEGGVFKESVAASNSIAGDYAGIRVSPSVRTVPAVVKHQDGRAIGSKARIMRASLFVSDDTDGVLVNDRYIRQQQKGAGEFNIMQVRLSGWKYNPSIEITQKEPAPLLVQAVQMEVQG